MAEKIKGFTIELGLDALKVDSGLKDVRKSISAMNNEMKSNMSVFDRSERSMKKYETQLGGLNKKLELQKQIVQQAKDDYDKLKNSHDENSKVVRDAADAYNRENAQLNNLERYVQRVTKEMQAFKREQEIQSSAAWKAGDALENFGNKMDTISSKARSVGGDLTKYLTLPITGAITALTGMGISRAMGLEQVDLQLRHITGSEKEAEKVLNRVSDMLTGTSFMTVDIGGAISQMIPHMSEDDAFLHSEMAMNIAAFSGDNSIAPNIADAITQGVMSGQIDENLASRFRTAGIDVYSVLGNQFNMSKDKVKDSIKDGTIDIHEAMRGLSNGILEGTKGVNGETNAFGGMLEETGDTLKGKSINFLASISQLGERMVTEHGIFDGLKEMLTEGINFFSEADQLLIPIFAGMAKAMERLVDIARKLTKWFISLDDSTKQNIGKFVGLAAVIGPIITAFGIFGGIIAKVSKSIGGLFKWIAPLTKGLGFVGKGAGGAGKSVGLFGRAASLLGGPIGIAIGVITLLVTAFTIAYKKSETFREFVHLLGEKLKEVFEGIVEWIQPGIDAVLEFFGQMKEKIGGFIEEEGPQIMEALSNIGEFFSIVFGAIWGVVKWTFEKIKWIIVDYVMPLIELVIVTTWENIKVVINGALDIILGLIKVFSGLFTGDFSKMWEGVKDIFFAAIDIVWGLIKNSFVGRIIQSAIEFVGNFRSHMSNLWKTVKSLFTTYITSVYTSIKNSFVGRIIGAIVGFVSNFKTNITNLWNDVKTNFSNKISEIRTSIENSFIGRIISSVTTMKNDFVGIAKDMWTGVKEQFDNIVDGAKKLPGKIGDGIKSAKNKATSAMKGVGNSVIEWAGKPFNKVVDGVNWVTGKLGVKSKVAKWDYPQYAQGTKGGGHPGGLAVVGDKFGRELINLPDGKSFISPGTDTLMNLPKGTHVIPNRETEKILDGDIPMYAKGTKGWFSSFKSAVGDVWDYVKNPGKIVTKLIDKISLQSGMAEIPRSIVKGGFDYVKSMPAKFLKKMFKDNEDNNPNVAGKPAFNWPVTSQYGYRMHPIHKTLRLHAGTDFGAPSGAPIPSQTAGTVNYAARMGGFGNLVRVKSGIWEMYYAHMSKIMTKVGKKVKKGDILGLVGSTGDSTGPHLHYETRKNGQPINPMSLKGFKTGGVIKERMMAMLGEDGEEIVIPTNPNRRTDAMKLLALAAKKIGVDGGNYTRPSNIPNPNSDDGYMLQMLEALTEQNQLLMKILQKDTNVTINKKDMVDVVNQENAHDDIGRFF